MNEFGAYVRARDAHEGPEFEMPAFVLLYLPDDHTGGTRPNFPRPAASVADNDLALGRVVDAVSHSGYWDDTAIFVLEDDAQDGADHVDAHRSIAFVISKYSPGSAAQPYVEHRFYTTVNVVHTMEMLLGLPPMNQNDAYAPLMGRLFSGSGDQPAYKADYRNLKNGLIYERNRTGGSGGEDLVDDGLLASGREQRGEAESSVVAGSERGSAHACGEAHGVSRGRRLRSPFFEFVEFVANDEIPLLAQRAREKWGTLPFISNSLMPSAVRSATSRRP